MKFFAFIFVLSIFVAVETTAQAGAAKTVISHDSGWKSREANKTDWHP